MNREQQILVAATLFVAVGLGLMLPRGGRRGRRLGILLGLASLVLFGTGVPYLGGMAGHSLFLFLAGVTIVSAAATVTSRNPVYSAIWFALSLAGTAGLFLCQGAQFLGVATVVVYAGAIVVTFLFVLMLANPTGQASFDRWSWESWLSAGAGAVMVGALSVTLAEGIQNPPSPAFERGEAFNPQPPTLNHQAPAAEAITEVRPQQRPEKILAQAHMAHLGKELFSRHLIAVEVAGTLLLVALVGAVAMIEQGRAAERVQGSGFGVQDWRSDAVLPYSTMSAVPYPKPLTPNPEP